MWINGIGGPVWVTDDQVNVNTGMFTPLSQTTAIDEYGNSVPFNHASRLLDKLFGAVEVKLDNYVAEDRITALRNNLLYQSVQTPISYLPSGIAEWVNRNISVLMGIVVVTFLSLAVIKFARR
jgi:hypothetical protein